MYTYVAGKIKTCKVKNHNLLINIAINSIMIIYVNLLQMIIIINVVPHTMFFLYMMIKSLHYICIIYMPNCNGYKPTSALLANS